jgi:hypothetical protein
VGSGEKNGERFLFRSPEWSWVSSVVCLDHAVVVPAIG